jgi:hypothetical protein
VTGKNEKVFCIQFMKVTPEVPTRHGMAGGEHSAF